MRSKIIPQFILLLTFSVWADGREPKCEYLWQDTIATKSNLNILDYFLLLPSYILNCDAPQQGYRTAKERLALTTKIDINNGYISFFKRAEIALFKNKRDGIDIIAVQIGMCGAGANCGAINSLMQFDKNSKKWVFRNDLLPNGFTHEELYEKYVGDNDDLCPYFKLPVTGRVISIKTESTDSTLHQLKWEGTKFNYLITR